MRLETPRNATPATRNEATRRWKAPKVIPFAELPICTAIWAIRSSRGRLRTVADGCERLRPQTQRPANTAQPPHPQSETGTQQLRREKVSKKLHGSVLVHNRTMTLRTSFTDEIPSRSWEGPQNTVSQQGGTNQEAAQDASNLPPLGKNVVYWLIPSLVHTKHPPKCSQWNVEIPDKKPWFRRDGVFSMNGGWDY